VSRVEGSLWRCVVFVFDEHTRSRHECDTQLEQADLEDHLRHTHKMPVERPADAMDKFVLVRTSIIGRGPGRRGKVEDETIMMFEFEEKR